jgi:hypothetical protein
MDPFYFYYLRVFFSPGKAFEAILSHPKRLLFGFYAGLTIIFLYSITLAGNIISGVVPVMPPFIKIPINDYYIYEIFFQGPVFIFGWILSSGLAYLTSKLLNGKGSFEDTLSVLGFAMNIPWILTWLIDTIIMSLYLSEFMLQKEWIEMITRPGIWLVFNALYPLISLIWSLVLVFIAISKSQKISGWRTAIVSLFVVLVNQIFITVFIR